MAARGRGSAGGSSRAPLVAGAAFLCVAVLLLAATPAAEAGATYFVGDAAGWGGTRGFDYAQWAAGKTFHAGDILGTSSYVLFSVGAVFITSLHCTRSSSLLMRTRTCIA